MTWMHIGDPRQARFSVAMTEPTNRLLAEHLDKGRHQEDLTFALWRPSEGHTRLTAIIDRVILPSESERILQGNVAFTADYLQRVLALADGGHGIALLHSHLGPGWQDMSPDDIAAERVRLAAAVEGRTGLPLLGLTWGPTGRGAPGSGCATRRAPISAAGQRRYGWSGSACT